MILIIIIIASSSSLSSPSRPRPQEQGYSFLRLDVTAGAPDAAATRRVLSATGEALGDAAAPLRPTPG